MMQLDDEILNAYLDGELEPAEHAAVEAALARDAQARARLDALRRVSLLGRAAVDALSRSAVDESLQERVWPLPARPEPGGRGPAATGWAAAVLSGALVLLLGIGIGAWLFQPVDRAVMDMAAAPVAWHRQAAWFHRLASERQARGRPLVLDLEAGEPARLQAAVNERLQQQVLVPDLSDLGLRPLGARLLVEQARPLAQIFYQDAGGSLVSLLVALDSGPDVQPRFERVDDGPATVHWRRANTRYVLAAEPDRVRLQDLVPAVAERTAR